MFKTINMIDVQPWLSDSMNSGVSLCCLHWNALPFLEYLMARYGIGGWEGKLSVPCPGFSGLDEWLCLFMLDVHCSYFTLTFIFSVWILTQYIWCYSHVLFHWHCVKCSKHAILFFFLLNSDFLLIRWDNFCHDHTSAPTTQQILVLQEPFTAPAFIQLFCFLKLISAPHDK